MITQQRLNEVKEELTDFLANRVDTLAIAHNAMVTLFTLTLIVGSDKELRDNKSLNSLLDDCMDYVPLEHYIYTILGPIKEKSALTDVLPTDA